MDRLYRSFWRVALANFPIGTFRRRALSTEEARGLLTQARKANTLVCVAKADLAAPYHQRDREKHRQLCEALRRDADIRVDREDFFGAHTANGLFLAEVSGGASLLVVDCSYTTECPERDDAHASGVGSGKVEPHQPRLAAMMSVVPESIAFRLFERVGPVPVESGN